MVKKYFVYFYYLALLGVFLSWTNPDIVPNHILIIGFMVAEVIPVVMGRRELLPMVISLFVILAKTGVSNSYSPTDLLYYVALIIGVFAISRIKYVKPPKVLILLFLWIFVVNLFSFSYSSQAVLKSHIIYDFYIPFIFLLFFYSYKNVPAKYIHVFSLIFAAISLVLTYEFHFLGSQYTSTYGGGLDRIEWMDPNYFGCVLGMGAFTLASEIFMRYFKNKIFTILMIISAFVILLTMILNASRGSILSLAVAVSVLVLFSKIKTPYKVLAIVGCVVFCIVLYNNGYMELLQYRINRDGGSNITNDRTLIWITKLNAFFNESNIFRLLFGYGYYGGLYLGYDAYQGFHNDFVAFLCEYGIFGLILFVCFILYPIHQAKNNRSLILAGELYLLVSSFSLEPFNLGIYANFAFWLYLVFLSEMPQQTSNNNDEEKTLIYNV